MSTPDLSSLSHAERTAYDHLRGGGDVPISRLFYAVAGHEVASGEYVGRRRQQMRVGASVSRLNAKLRDHGLVVRPGIQRRTYRLARADEPIES